MNTKTHCPTCGKPLAPDAPMGLCPDCLLNAGIGTFTADAGGNAPVSALPPPSPEELAPHFPQLEILALLGRGGMGVVYKARQKALNRMVALKILAPERVRDPQFAERFAREAQALALLDHPHIVTVHDSGQAGGFFYLLMEFVDGVNLRELLRARKLTPEEALAIVPPLCDALQFAHDRGIIHRDIKPENLLLDKNGQIKIADFGIAKMIGESADTASESTTPAADSFTHQAAGTPGYMAPEQKHTPQQVDNRADIYSLGVVFYEMLTGELPGSLLEAPSRKVRIDVRLDEVVLRALEQKPELRWQTAMDLRTRVETIAATERSIEQLAPLDANEKVADHGGAARTEDTPSAQAQATRPPRLSRTAIAGACWSAFAVIAFALTFTGYAAQAGEYHGPTWWQYLLMFTLLPLGISAPFGTTLLGWIAVSQIRRSAGKRYGMWLAVCDGLLFPLLALDALIVLASGNGHRFYVAHFADVSRPLDNFIVGDGCKAIVLLLALATIALTNLIIIRRVWHTVSQPLNGANDVSPAMPPRSGNTRKWALAVTALVLVTLGTGTWWRISEYKDAPYLRAITPAQNPVFGPVIERTIPLSKDFTSYIDFQTGSVIRKHWDIGEALDEKVIEIWMKQTGADAFAEEIRDSPPRLIGVHAGCSCVFVDVRCTIKSADTFESAQARDVDACLKPVTERNVCWEYTTEEATYWFKTHDGAKGIVQILGFTDNPRGVKIRYKLSSPPNK